MAFPSPLPEGGVEEIAVTSVFLLLAILSVVARFYSRSLQRKAIWIDDYLIVAGLIFTIATVGVGYALVLNGGVGLHMADATPEQVANSLKLFVAAPLLWAIATSLIKLSILWFYISIFTMPRLRTAVFVVIALTIALIVAVIFESFLLCRPFTYTWDKTIQGGVCGNSTNAYLAIAIINLVIDLAIVFLPMPVLWGLQMPFGKKVAISSILALGLLVCGLTAARISSVIELDPLDFTYRVVPDLIFGALEIELGIVIACLPILRPVISKISGSEKARTRGWSKQSDFSGGSSNPQKGAGINNYQSFDHLPESIYPMGVVSPMPTSETLASAHGDPFQDLEYGRGRVPGDIMVRRDLYVYRS